MKIVHVENRNAIFGRMNIDKLRIHNVHTYFIRNAYFLRKHNLIVIINAGYKPLFLPKLVNILLLFKFLSASTLASSILNLLDHVTVRVFTGSDLITGSDRIGPEIGYLAHLKHSFLYYYYVYKVCI